MFVVCGLYKKRVCYVWGLYKCLGFNRGNVTKVGLIGGFCVGCGFGTEKSECLAYGSSIWWESVFSIVR